MEDPMPTTYETHTTTTTTSSSGVAINQQYITSKEGILRIVEIVLSLLVLICSAVGFLAAGSGWVQFVGAWCFVTIIIWFILYLLGLNVRLPGPAILIELIYFALMALFNLIAGIVAAVVGAYPPMGAAAFFCFACLIVLGVDCFFLFQAYRSGVSTATMSSSSHTTSTTVVTEKETY